MWSLVRNMTILRCQLRTWTVSRTPPPQRALTFSIFWNPRLLRPLLSSLNSQFLLSARLLEISSCTWMTEKWKNAWKGNYVTFWPSLLCGPPVSSIFSQTPVSLAATDTKSLISLVQWNDCFLVRLYSSSLLFFLRSLHVPRLPNPVTVILGEKHSR